MHDWWNGLVSWAERQQAGDAFAAETTPSYDEAAYDRPPTNRAALRKKIAQSNPVRFRRLMREFKWVQKKMKKMGLNPEDARWLL